MHFTKKGTYRQGFPTVIVICAVIAALAFQSCSGGDGDGSSSTTCDILIVGGGTGGFAAAYQACTMAETWGVKKIIMTEENSWLGGQYTSQGVTASDDNSLVEQGKYTVGASKQFFRFHETIRDLYRPVALENARKTKRTGDPDSRARKREIEWIEGTEFSPGNAWGSRMSFLPKDGVLAIDRMLDPYIESGLLTIHYTTVPIEVIKDRNRVTGVRLRNTGTGGEMTVHADVTLDATELGDLLPLAGIDYRVGIEASGDTGEPSLFGEDGAPLYPGPMTDCVQSFTYTFAVEWRPADEDNRLPWEQRPASYEENRHRFTMVDADRWFLMSRWNDFSRAQIWEENRRTGGNKPLTWIPSFWTYRRMLDARLLNPDLGADLPDRFSNGVWRSNFNPDKDPEYFAPNWQHSPPGIGDVIEVNWNSNDYNGKTIIDIPEDEREAVLKEAKELSLGFLFWLWYEAPRDPDDPRLDPAKEENWSIDPVTGKNTGYANLKYRPDVMGTEDGLSMYPYIRESRRARALFTVKQQHLLGPRTSRARLFHDTVGIGHYFLDIHRCDVGCERKRDINFKHVQLSDGSWAGENSSGRFQIPFGALVPETVDGIMAAAKNIGLTRIAASTYRLHPVEFEIGKAAGAAAVLCVAEGIQPRDIWVSGPKHEIGVAEKRLRRLQHELLSSGTPLFWNEDSGWDTDVFEPVQWACLLEIIEPHGRLFEPEKPLTRSEAVIALARLSGKELTDSSCSVSFTDVTTGPADLREAVTIIEGSGALDWIQGENLRLTEPVTESQFLGMLGKVMENEQESGADTQLIRGAAAGIVYRVLADRFGLPMNGKS